MTKLVFIHVPIRNMYFLSGMEGFKKSEGRSTRGASSLQYWLRPPPQNWMRPYDSCSSAPTALMKKLSTANLLSIHVLILRIFVFGGATRIVGAGSRQSQIGLCKGVLLANPLPGASGLGKLTRATNNRENIFFHVGNTGYSVSSWDIAISSYCVCGWARLVVWRWLLPDSSGSHPAGKRSQRSFSSKQARKFLLLHRSDLLLGQAYCNHTFASQLTMNGSDFCPP